MNISPLPCLTVAASCELAKGGDGFTWHEIKQTIEAGKARVFQTDNGSYFVLACHPPDLEILACTGKDAPSIMRACMEIARLNGCDFVHFITRHKGLPRLLNEFNPQSYGTIYRINAHESTH